MILCPSMEIFYNINKEVNKARYCADKAYYCN